MLDLGCGTSRVAAALAARGVARARGQASTSATSRSRGSARARRARRERDAAARRAAVPAEADDDGLKGEGGGGAAPSPLFRRRSSTSCRTRRASRRPDGAFDLVIDKGTGDAVACAGGGRRGGAAARRRRGGATARPAETPRRARAPPGGRVAAFTGFDPLERVAAAGDRLRLVEAVEVVDDLEPAVASSGASGALVFEKPDRDGRL